MAREETIDEVPVRRWATLQPIKDFLSGSAAICLSSMSAASVSRGADSDRLRGFASSSVAFGRRAQTATVAARELDRAWISVQLLDRTVWHG